MVSSSQKQAVITLIQKKDRGAMLIKNWKPVSLISVDIKLHPKLWLSELEKFYLSLIHCDRTACVKVWYIGDSVRLINDLLEYAEEENSDGILFAADIKMVLIPSNIILFLQL